MKHDLSCKLNEAQAHLVPEWLEAGITRLALYFRPRCNYIQ